jgi:amino acid permease
MLMHIFRTTPVRARKLCLVVMIYAGALVGLSMIIHNYHPDPFGTPGYITWSIALDTVTVFGVSFLTVLARDLMEIDDGLTDRDDISAAITVPVCVALAALIACAAMVVDGFAGLVAQAIIYGICLPLLYRLPRAAILAKELMEG